MSHLKDPTTQYYTGEYPKQKQPTPGIQAKMTPVPDCGEKTYVGSGRLKDRKALVTGGDSGIAPCHQCFTIFQATATNIGFLAAIRYRCHLRLDAWRRLFLFGIFTSVILRGRVF